MGMFGGIGACPRCWDNPCHCTEDAYGDPIQRFSVTTNGVFAHDPSVKQLQERQIELLEEQNELLKQLVEERNG